MLALFIYAHTAAAVICRLTTSLITRKAYWNGFTPSGCQPCLLGELAAVLQQTTSTVVFRRCYDGGATSTILLCLFIWYSTRHTEYRHLSDVGGGGLISRMPRVGNTTIYISHHRMQPRTLHRLWGNYCYYIYIYI